MVCISLLFIFNFCYSAGIFEYAGLFLNPIRSRAICLGLVMLLVFISSKPIFRNNLLQIAYQLFFIVVTIAISGYIVFGYENFVFRMGSATGFEVVFGFLAIITVFEACRRTTGNATIIVAVVFCFYAILGKYIPGFFRAPPASLTLLSGQVYIGLQGIYGLPMGVILDYIFSFLLFGAVLNIVGGMNFFVHLATRLFRNMVGAGAKIAIITNFFLGMVNGSTVAGVLLTGPLTIPQMRREGFSEHYMGALIAVAANAAQLMPPVMGIVAFAMAEYLHVSYITVALASLVPGLLYYLSLFIFASFEAKRKDIRPVPPPEPETEKTNMRQLVISNWPTLIAIAILISLLITQILPVRLAVTICSVFLLIAGFAMKSTRPNVTSLASIVKNTSRDMVSIVPVCATAGIIIACISITSLDYKVSSDLATVAGNSMILLLIFATFACVILGMGIPTLPAYIVVVLLVAPTMISLGLKPIIAHMFVYYMALAAMISPPVAINVFAVLPMVKSSIWRVGFTALSIGISQYIVPFLFVYRPALILGEGGIANSILSIVLAVVFFIAICFAIERYGLMRARWPEVVSAVAGALIIYFGFLFIQGATPYIVGALLLLFALISQIYRYKRLEAAR